MRPNCRPTPQVDGQPVGRDIDWITHSLLMSCYEPPKEIFLFGSGARSELTPSSDLDFGIVTGSLSLSHYVDRVAHRVLPRNRAIDLVVVHDALELTEEATDRLSWARAAPEGLVLYAGSASGVGTKPSSGGKSPRRRCRATPTPPPTSPTSTAPTPPTTSTGRPGTPGRGPLTPSRKKAEDDTMLHLMRNIPPRINRRPVTPKASVKLVRRCDRSPP